MPSKPFEITCRLGGSDYKLFVAVINQGIDSHLEGFTKSTFSQRSGDSRLVMRFDVSELPILLRRLREVDTEEARQWVDDIEETLEEWGKRK